MAAKDELKALVDEWFYGDVGEAEETIRRFLELCADHTEETEPYATVSIERERQASMNFSLNMLEE